jgi:hypothetical protein
MFAYHVMPILKATQLLENLNLSREEINERACRRSQMQDVLEKNLQFQSIIQQQLGVITERLNAIDAARDQLRLLVTQDSLGRRHGTPLNSRMPGQRECLKCLRLYLLIILLQRISLILLEQCQPTTQICWQ